VFHIRHIERSADRLPAYAEGGELTRDQILAVKTELAAAGRSDLFAEFAAALDKSAARIRALGSERLDRKVGKRALPNSGRWLARCGLPD
jgi:hypothetical protein